MYKHHRLGKNYLKLELNTPSEVQIVCKGIQIKLKLTCKAGNNMKRDTFSLTAIREPSYAKTAKLPDIGNEPKRRAEHSLPNRLTRTQTQASVSRSKHTEIKDLLTSIRGDSAQ